MWANCYKASIQMKNIFTRTLGTEDQNIVQCSYVQPYFKTIFQEASEKLLG